MVSQGVAQWDVGEGWPFTACLKEGLGASSSALDWAMEVNKHVADSKNWNTICLKSLLHEIKPVDPVASKKRFADSWICQSATVELCGTIWNCFSVLLKSLQVCFLQPLHPIQWDTNCAALQLEMSKVRKANHGCCCLSSLHLNGEMLWDAVRCCKMSSWSSWKRPDKKWVAMVFANLEREEVHWIYWLMQISRNLQHFVAKCTKIASRGPKLETSANPQQVKARRPVVSQRSWHMWDRKMWGDAQPFKGSNLGLQLLLLW